MGHTTIEGIAYTKKGWKTMIQTLTQSSFEAAIQSKAPVLVDFWASWCGPCMMQGEVLSQISEEYPALSIGKVNVDEYPELAQRFGISAIPTMILFKDGSILEAVTGLRSAEQVLALFRQYGGQD
jgi:thioredoxin 1